MDPSSTTWRWQMYDFAIVALLALATLKLVDFLTDAVPQLRNLRSLATFVIGVGATVLIPFGHSLDFDLVAEAQGRLSAADGNDFDIQRLHEGGGRAAVSMTATSGFRPVGRFDGLCGPWRSSAPRSRSERGSRGRWW